MHHLIGTLDQQRVERDKKHSSINIYSAKPDLNLPQL